MLNVIINVAGQDALKNITVVSSINQVKEKKKKKKQKMEKNDFLHALLIVAWKQTTVASHTETYKQEQPFWKITR